jgi:hypothetical protein
VPGATIRLSVPTLGGVVSVDCEVDGAIERAAALANCCSACTIFFCNSAGLVAGLFGLSNLKGPVSPAFRELDVVLVWFSGLEEIVCFQNLITRTVKTVDLSKKIKRRGFMYTLMQISNFKWKPLAVGSR